MEKISVKMLFNAQAHWGHMKKYRHPSMKKYVFKTYRKQDVIDIEITINQIYDAKTFLKFFKKEEVLFIGNSLLDINEIDMFKKWKPGMLTNFKYGCLKKIPKIIVLETLVNNEIAINEAKKLGIPIIGICDTNISANLISKPVVMNDDSVVAKKMVLDYLLTFA